MDNRLLTKLLSSPVTKMTWSQIQRIKQLMPNKKDVHSSSVKPDTVCLRSASATNLSTEQKHLLEKLNTVPERGFSTSTSHSFWNKLTTYDQQQYQVPAQLYAQKAEVEPLLVEGVGWAGQPVVRRTHPILPESYGGLPDIFTDAVEKMPEASRAHEEGLKCVQAKPTPNNTQLRSVNVEGKEGSTKNSKNAKDTLVDTNKTREEAVVRSQPKSSDGSSLVGENIKSGSRKYVLSKEADTNFSTPLTIKENGGVEMKTGVTKKDKGLKKMKSIHSVNSGVVLTKTKKKSKKITKVCDSKAHTSLMTKKKAKKSKKNNGSRPTFGVSKKRSLQSNILTSHRPSAQPARKSVVILASRQIQTYSHPNQAKLSVNIKERTSATVIALGSKLKKSSTAESGGKYPEDCKCPETLEIKTRFPTKICGEAAGAEKKKKKKEWKGKMCPIEHQLKHRRRTLVCSSAKFGKAKRKRQLPKCEKPEKKIAPRVLICPPELEDELKKEEKKCVKEVEEIKIRSRTKVCKPVIMYQKEEKIVQVEKAVCTEKKVKKTISRHTKVCPPSEENKDKKESKR